MLDIQQSNTDLISGIIENIGAEVERRKKIRRKFNEEENLFLTENFNKYSDRVLGEMMGRSILSVKIHRQRLGLKKPDRTKPKVKFFWTAKRIDILKKNYKTLTYQAIGEILKCRATYVYKKAKSLGLSKRPLDVWTKEEESILIENYGVIYSSEIAALLNRTTYSIRHRASRLRLRSKLKNPASKRMTLEEEEKFKELFPITPNDELRKIFNFSKHSISKFAKLFNLSKTGYRRGIGYIEGDYKKDRGTRYIKRGGKQSLRIEELSFQQKKEFIELYPNAKTVELTEKFGLIPWHIRQYAKQLGLKKSKEFFAQFGRNNFFIKSKNFEFFQEIKAKFDLPQDFVLQIDRDRVVVRQSNNKRTLLKIYLWERAFGPIPSGQLVMFKDGNNRNFELENLELSSCFSNKVIRIKNPDSIPYQRSRAISKYPEDLHELMNVIIEARHAIKAYQKLHGISRYKQRSHNPWCEEEIEFLRSNYHSQQNTFLMEKLNRPMHSITTMAFRLGLTNRRGTHRFRNGKTGGIWTDANLEILKRDYPTTTSTELAKIFGCQKYYVTQKARELGMHKGRGNRILN